MIVNEYRAKEELNRWAIRPEIEPQLRRSDLPLYSLRVSNLPVAIPS
jgi:hypothetical protein